MGTAGGGGKATGGAFPDVTDEARTLCQQNCAAVVELDCDRNERCAAVCFEWLRDSPDECGQAFVDYLACIAPRPASDFVCDCCGWVEPKAEVCAVESQTYHDCAGF